MEQNHLPPTLPGHPCKNMLWDIIVYFKKHSPLPQKENFLKDLTATEQHPVHPPHARTAQVPQIPQLRCLPDPCVWRLGAPTKGSNRDPTKPHHAIKKN